MKKTLRLFTLLTIFILSEEISYGQQWIDEEKDIKIIYDFKLNVINGDSSLDLNLSFVDISKNTTYDYGNINLNNANKFDTTRLKDILKERYLTSVNLFGKQLISKHQEFLSNMTTKINDTIVQKRHTFVYQGLYMYLSILNAANREIKNSESIEFTIMDTYLLEISAFCCEEDVYINIPELISYMEKRKTWDKENVGIDYYLGAFKNSKDINLNMVQIKQKLEEYFKSQPSGKWPPGTACGCCGNYSGPCLYWSHACLAHDLQCQECQAWWCGWACQSTSCINNFIATRWY